MLKLSYSYVSIRMHTRVHGGLYIYLHKMPGKHPDCGRTLGGNLCSTCNTHEVCTAHHAVEMDDRHS